MGTAVASADAAKWAARGATAAAAQGEDVMTSEALEEVAKLSKGSSVVMLHAAGREEEEDKALREALEEQGVEVTSRAAGQEGGPSFAEEVLSEVQQMLGVSGDSDAAAEEDE